MFNPGDYAFDKAKNERIQILAVSDVWGFVSYKVYCPADDAVYKLSEDAITASHQKQSQNVSYLRYVALLAKIKNEIAGGVVSKLASGVIPLPHQIHVLNRAISDNNVRYILADEVGLGKTIEAGLIIKELKTRGIIRRVLVVCPTGLVTQWNAEMREKFGETFRIIQPDEFSILRKITDSEDIYGQFDQVISPMDSIKPLERRAGWTDERIAKYNEERIFSIINSDWDLIVIDEAHRVAGSSGEVARYKLGALLAGASPYLLLLTATPHNGKTEPFLRLVRLLDEGAFPNYRAITKEQVAPFVIRTEKRDAIDSNGNRLFKNRTTKAITLTWDDRHTMQRKLYEMVTRYVSTNYNRALRARGKNMWFIFLLIMMQRLVSSSTSAIRESMERRVHALEHQETSLRSMSEDKFADMELEMEMDDAISAMSLDIKAERAQLNERIAIAKQAEYQYLDAKVEPFLEIIDDLFAEDRERKVIVFTEFVATQNYVSGILTKRGYITSLLNGSMDIDVRNAVLSEFREESDILISTDAGGEGLNLQFANCVVNYDLPWNPMKIEQRIGRVDRIGQQRDVTAYNFLLTDTVETRVREVLEQKLTNILRELGVDKYSDVLDTEQAEMDFTDAYMKSIGKPYDIEENITPVEDDLRNQLENRIKIKELIREDKDLGSLVGSGMNFDMEESLRMMMGYYERSMGNTTLALDAYTLTDPAIKCQLKRDLEFNPDSDVMRVTIRDFPNEAGYFMLWELSVSSGEQSRRFVPVFINEDFVLRPLAGGRIWEALLDENKQITVSNSGKLDRGVFKILSEKASAFAFDTFTKLKDETSKRHAETHRKRMYAFSVRIEAARRIGIENIRNHKLTRLEKECENEERRYEAEKMLCPEFRAALAAYMVSGDD
jgi:superfamily II DNA or RNA helicase